MRIRIDDFYGNPCGTLTRNPALRRNLERAIIKPLYNGYYVTEQNEIFTCEDLHDHPRCDEHAAVYVCKTNLSSYNRAVIQNPFWLQEDF